jgi:tetratricopeptide (TPR) repeat protein
MLKRTIFIGLVLALCMNVRADYPSDRKAATALYAAGKNEEALAAFRKMAAEKVTDFQKSDALEQAAMCAHRLKQFDLAMDLALQIPIAQISKSVQLNHLVYQRKWKEVVEKFKDEDISSWPNDIAGRSFFFRAQSYSVLGDGKKAEADFKNALKYPLEFGMKGQVLQGLGDAYQNILKDDEQALSTYRMMYQAGGARYLQIHAAISAAKILMRQEKYDEAIQELKKIDTKDLTLFWRYDMLCLSGNILAKQGKKPEALLKYGEALRLEGITTAQKDAAQKALNELQAEDK